MSDKPSAEFYIALSEHMQMFKRFIPTEHLEDFGASIKDISVAHTSDLILSLDRLSKELVNAKA